MGYPTVTYTFSTGENVDATEVNTNLTDIVNGLSDGTKNIKINNATIGGALTGASTPSITGAVTLSSTLAVLGAVTQTGTLTVNNNILNKIFRTQEEEKTLSSDAMTPTSSRVVINGEGGLADDLATITATNFNDGDLLILSRKSTSGDITVKNTTGNILCGSDRTISTNSTMLLIYNGIATKWDMLSYAAN